MGSARCGRSGSRHKKVSDNGILGSIARVVAALRGDSQLRGGDSHAPNLGLDSGHERHQHARLPRQGHAAVALDSFVGNSIGTGIKPQSEHTDAATKEQSQSLWLR